MDASPVEKQKKAGRRKKVFKLKTRPAGNTPGSSNGEGEASQFNNGNPPGSEKKQATTLAEMERQLRANAELTLPSSSEARAELALSLPRMPPAGASPTIIQVPDAVIGSTRSRRKKRVKPTATRWVVATDWAFSSEVLGDIPFAKELWMMMASFGDPRGEIVCRCEAHGGARCGCIEAVAVMEPLVRAFARSLVAVCREWSSPQAFSIKHLRTAMPGEMREFMAWRDAHAKRGTKNVHDKQAGVAVGDEDVDDDDGIEENEEADKSDAEGGDGDGDLGDDNFAVEEEEVATRISHRKRFADEMTADMDEGAYLQLYYEYRKAFFVLPRGTMRSVKPGSRLYLANYIGLGKSKEGKDKKLLEALGYMMYDYVGLLVETAIRKRTGGRLEALPQDGEEPSMLTGDDITAAAERVPPFPSRSEREHARAVRVANPSGISHKSLQGFRVGLDYRGDPLKWPCNTVESGRVRVDGGEIVDTSDGKLAAEAMFLLETDFADFDS